MSRSSRSSHAPFHHSSHSSSASVADMPTLSSILKSNKNPFKDLRDLREGLKRLQRENEQQVMLEMESQQTFEHFASQISSLRYAFSTLADVLVEEVDGAKQEAERLHQISLTEMKKLEHELHTCNKGIRSLRVELASCHADIEAQKHNTQSRFEAVNVAADLLTARIEDANRSIDSVRREVEYIQKDLNLQPAVMAESILLKQQELLSSSIPLSASQVSKRMNALHSGLKQQRTSDLISSLTDELLHLKKKVDTTKKESNEACTALAMDVNTIFEDSKAFKAKQEDEAISMRRYLEDLRNAIEERVASRSDLDLMRRDVDIVRRDVEVVHREVLDRMEQTQSSTNAIRHDLQLQIAKVGELSAHKLDTVSHSCEVLSKATQDLSRQQARQKQSVDEALQRTSNENRSIANETRVLSHRLSNLEDGYHAVKLETRQIVGGLETQLAKHIDFSRERNSQVSDAVHFLSDYLNIACPLVSV